MKRSNFLGLTNLTDGEFDSRRQRDQLPYSTQSGKWSVLSPYNAFLVVVADQYARIGSSLKDAARDVRHADSMGQFTRAWPYISDPKQPDVFFAYVEQESLEQAKAATPRSAYDFHELVGTRVDVNAFIDKLERNGRPIFKIKLTNISDAWRLVKQRAADVGVDISNAFGGDGTDEE